MREVERVRDELQDLVDRVSALLGAPATLEDAEFTLLAFCAHDGAAGGGMDPVRTRSILARGSPPETRRWFEEFGIARAEHPLRTPADREAGILTRLMLPVRHAGRTRGYLWLLDDGRTDPDDPGDPALAAAVDLAAEAGRLLAGRGPAEGSLDRVLRAALTGTTTGRERAGRSLAEGLVTAAAQVLVALVPADADLPEDWRPPGAGAVSAVLDDGTGAPLVAVLVPLRVAGDLRPASALAAAALARLPGGASAGMSAVRAGFDDLAGQWAQARAAARVAAAVPEFSPVAHWAELGPWRAVSALPEPDPVVRPLTAQPGLARTAEVFLDNAGSAQRTAAALGIHRQTLYYRLGRVAELTGLDLADGADRLLLHTALKAARLSPRRPRH